MPKPPTTVNILHCVQEATARSLLDDRLLPQRAELQAVVEGRGDAGGGATQEARCEIVCVCARAHLLLLLMLLLLLLLCLLLVQAANSMQPQAAGGCTQ